MNLSPRRMLAVGLAAFLLAGCRPKPAPQPDPPPTAAPPLASASTSPLNPASAGAVPSASAPRALAEIPEWTAEILANPPRKQPRGLGTIEGAVVLWEGTQLGRLTDKGVEWMDRKIPPSGPQGDNHIYEAGGRWPDEIGVFFASSNNRSPDHTYFPLTGQGAAKPIGVGGISAYFNGMARLGGTTLVEFEEFSTPGGSQIAHVRGPLLHRIPISPQKAGCTEEESTTMGGYHHEKFAVNPHTFGTTREGTLLSVGSFCRTRGYAAEVWDKSTQGDRTTTSKIVDLTHWIQGKYYFPHLFQGNGDEAWLVDFYNHNAIVQYKDGAFTALAPTPTPPTHAFVSLGGQLHTSDGQAVYRYEDGAWRTLARFSWPLRLQAMALDGEAMWADVEGEILRLRPGPGLAATADCKTPFVHLYSPSVEMPARYGFPGTLKAIAGFEGAAGLVMTDFQEAGSRRLGVAVSSKAQGEALIAHLKTTLKDESPRLICFEPPRTARVLTITPTKK